VSARKEYDAVWFNLFDFVTSIEAALFELLLCFKINALSFKKFLKIVFSSSTPFKKRN